MFKKVLLAFFILVVTVAHAQTGTTKFPDDFINKKTVAVTPVKDQAMTGTCWCFSSTAMVESQCLKNKTGELDLSEMYIVRNIYVEKAKNYLLRQGHAQFGEGGLGHDLIRGIATYGAIPESVYSGLKPGQKQHNHVKLSADLLNYLDSILKTRPIPGNWLEGYTKILDDALGKVPAEFDYKGRTYSPRSFAKEVLKFNAGDFVNITSFTHHPYYAPFILEVPDNFSDGAYYNIPLAEMIQATKDAVKNGYSVLWDTDASNNGFMQTKGLALLLNDTAEYAKDAINADMKEGRWDTTKRQQLFEDLTTEDDHLMQIFGIERSKTGKDFFLVKNSWGKIGPYDGDINVSEAYFAINTVSLVIPKAALSKTLLAKLQIR